MCACACLLVRVSNVVTYLSSLLIRGRQCFAVLLCCSSSCLPVYTNIPCPFSVAMLERLKVNELWNAWPCLLLLNDFASSLLKAGAWRAETLMKPFAAGAFVIDDAFAYPDGVQLLRAVLEARDTYPPLVTSLHGACSRWARQCWQRCLTFWAFRALQKIEGTRLLISLVQLACTVSKDKLALILSQIVLDLWKKCSLATGLQKS